MRPLPESVLAELAVARGLCHFSHVDIAGNMLGRAYCSDASTEGWAFHYTDGDPGRLWDEAVWRERWRFVDDDGGPAASAAAIRGIEVAPLRPEGGGLHPLGHEVPGDRVLELPTVLLLDHRPAGDRVQVLGVRVLREFDDLGGRLPHRLAVESHPLDLGVVVVDVVGSEEHSQSGHSEGSHE